ncbi:RNA polymerase sigma factor [Marinicrinis lubricantis]|uniref:RNA polymerase sigma factor n=1 Tax=Marinicrinis lubricantis TaxID=2086470 RepID=A0ABW1IK23_9BACL
MEKTSWGGFSQLHEEAMEPLEALPEERLTEMARTGDTRAFGELVRRGRSQMYKWARSLIQDHHQAEDVVQEALVQAFLHVGQLMENSRFKPWLAKIIRNQAYMKLRRGGPFAKEQPFSSLQQAEHTGNMPEGDWHDIDRVLFHLCRHREAEIQQSRDPQASLLRKEMVEGIRQLYGCLSRREKDIFEAHFFNHVTPNELAAVLDTSIANVYNSISRARAKLQRERLRMHISMYVKQRRDTGKPKSKLLVPPKLYCPKGS